MDSRFLSQAYEDWSVVASSDPKRFPNTHGWAYADWAYDAATDTLKPSQLSQSGTECGYACHTRVSAQDYIFTAYPKR